MDTTDLYDIVLYTYDGRKHVDRQYFCLHVLKTETNVNELQNRNGNVIPSIPIVIFLSMRSQTTKISGRETLKNGRILSGANSSNHYIF